MTLTIEELEAVPEELLVPDFTRHELEGPALSMHRMFYPMGFPTELRTNSSEILAEAEKAWSSFDWRFETEPIRVDVHVAESAGTTECPPEPQYSILPPLVVSVADAENYSIANLADNTTRIHLSEAVLRQPEYLRYFFLEHSSGCQIATRYATPIHAGCVALGGRGVLLCGDSGAGKSTLAYASARAGLTYVSDDASLLLHSDAAQRKITGNCHQVRFRPSAVQLFPEVEGLEITPRANGKPSIELPTSLLPNFSIAPHARADFVVFLNRRTGGAPELRPYRTDVARRYMRQVLYGSRESLAFQYEAIEHLLTAELFELRYSSLDWAVDRLRRLMEEGR